MYLRVRFRAFFVTVITEGPVSVTVLIGADAQFNCAGTDTGDHITISWKVDGLASANPVIKSRGIKSVLILGSGTAQSNLTVRGTPENNGTTVQCIVFSSSGLTLSNNSTLTVLPGESI